MSASLPYIIESNIVFENYCHQSSSELSDGYFAVCAEKEIKESVKNNGGAEHRQAVWWLILAICMIALLFIGLMVIIYR